MLVVVFLAVSCSAETFILIGIPDTSYSAVKQARFDAFIRRFSAYRSATDTLDWFRWRQKSAPGKLWRVTCLSWDNLRVNADKLDDAKLQELRDRINDANIRIVTTDDPRQTLKDYGLEPVPLEGESK